MSLKNKCKKLGLDYLSMSLNGFSDALILSMCNNLSKIEAKQQENSQPFWSFKMLDESKKEAELLIYGQISSLVWWGDEVTPRNFNDELQALGDVDTLTLRINSPGGDIFSGNAIYNMLMRFKDQKNATIVVYVDGIAASMASVIAMVGDKVIMFKNSMFMLHKPQGSVTGDSDKFRQTAELMDKLEDGAVVAYMDKSGLEEKEVRKIMKATSWITANEAVNKGFADEIENASIMMSISEENEMIINGLKFSDLPKFENKVQKPNVRELKKEKIIMNLQQLCMLLGLDYAMLAGKGISDDEIRLMCDNLQAKLPTSAPQLVATPPAAPAAQPQVNALSPQDVLNIQALCGEFGLDMKKANEFVTASLTVDQVKLKILDELKLQNKPLNAPPNKGDGIQLGAQEPDKIRMAATDGILLREGYSRKIDKPAEGANMFRNMSMLQMCIHFAEEMGISKAHMMNPEDLFKMALTPDSALSSIYTNTIQKSLLIAYQESQPTCMQWVNIGSNKDFKATKKFRISEVGVPELISQGGEFKHDEVTDQSIQTQLETWGKGFGFSRQAIINDDLSVLTSLPMMYVASNWRLINQLAYAIIGKNSNISYTNAKGTTTTKSMFHVDHGNYNNAGSVISTTSISEARKAMRTQKNLKGTQTLNIVPKFMLLPAELETVGKQFVNSEADPNSSNSGVINVFKNSMTPIIDAELDNYSSTAWHLLADPMQAPVVEVDFLNGNQNPTLETFIDKDFLGVAWRMFFDFSVTGIDFRGAYKNNGAAVQAP